MADGPLTASTLAEPPALTSLASGAGCGCKLDPAALLPLVGRLDGGDLGGRLLVGSASGDDAAVVRLDDSRALVQTVDFFTPPVDDPYDFGRIAAANALSDVYAMGGRPLCALNIVAFPLRTLGVETLTRVLEGGEAIVREAGAAIVGGHSIEDAEPKYGLAVTGLVDPALLVSNAGALPGDALVLTKPLGVGAVLAAHRHGRRDQAVLDDAVATMVALNALASGAALAAGAHAMTDVTGFGLLGHLHHICRESGLSAELDAAAVPYLQGVPELLLDGSGMSGGSNRNAAWAARFTRFAAAVPAWQRALLCDPTTSGGLLVALPPARAGELAGVVVGTLRDGPAGTIDVV